MTAAEGSHVRRLGGMHEIAGCEHVPDGRFQRGVHGRPARPLVDLDARQPGQLVIGNPVTGHHQRVAAHHPDRPGPHVGQLHAGQPRRPITRLTDVEVHTGTRQRSAAPIANAA